MNRRQALTGAAALFGLPLARATDTKIAPLPEKSLLDRDPEGYWKRIREEQFLLPNWRSFLNNGSLGVAPKPVVAAVGDYLQRGAALTMDDPYPRWGYETLDEHREELARYLGCKKDELALMHNATEAMSTVAAGLDLKPGDEVLMTDQEHPSGRSGWRQKEARYGIAVREVKIPLPPKNPEQLTDLLISAIGPRTRVLSFSGITSPTGLLMPVKEICSAARARGVITVVDGAHMHGQTPVRLNDLGCDFFAGSPHKWMFAPAGSGFLYIREEMVDRLWPLCVTGQWDDKKLKAARFMRMGTNNRAIFEGLIAGLRFGQAIGHERIYTRIHQLARRIRDRAAKIPALDLLTPDDDRMYAALVSIRFKKDPAPVWEETKKRKIFITTGERVRISAHIHTRPRDIDEFFDIVEAKVGRA
jgi:selenocysteine lyase/cysteine desulfurase